MNEARKPSIILVASHLLGWFFLLVIMAIIYVILEETAAGSTAIFVKLIGLILSIWTFWFERDMEPIYAIFLFITQLSIWSIITAYIHCSFKSQARKANEGDHANVH